MRISERIDALIQEHSLLKHPFYQAWSDGKLEMDSLAGYSKEYYQLVKAVPEFMDPLIKLAPEEFKAELMTNRTEESEHIELWEKFASSIGVEKSQLLAYSGSEKTRRAVSRLAVLMGTIGVGAAAMYAFEKEIPEISRIKLEGLQEFYGINSDDATRYFKLHMESDIRHAASWRYIIDNATDSNDDLYNAAVKSVWAQNLLLDTCFEQYCRNTNL
ncbi:MAG: TENA/THI-4 domain-containing protein, pyrroloquinoline-quinone synthase [Cenarchaeum symbiont of Oopsacas minuta]|nr:TENA/THI-4 domain-containing protein, pyrroloquinoline-quinone synthase [Cenarchaeum symbiont of Oopsacas minuta]